MWCRDTRRLFFKIMSSRVLVIEKLEGLVMVRLGNVEICMYKLTDPNKSDIYHLFEK